MKNLKFEQLKEYLGKYSGGVVACSGGVDSTFLLYVAHLVWKENVVALTVKSPYSITREMDSIGHFAKEREIKHEYIPVETFPNELRNNPEDRCYVCKHKVFQLLKQRTKELGLPVLVDGTNADDHSGYRPGLKALGELGIVSPMEDVGLTKAEIYQLSKELELPTGDKPSNSCLMSRFPYNVPISEPALRNVEKAEDWLYSKGFRQVRVRSQNNLARIELPLQEMDELLQLRAELVDELEKIGFEFVTIDLKGLRSGCYDKQLLAKRASNE